MSPQARDNYWLEYSSVCSKGIETDRSTLFSFPLPHIDQDLGFSHFPPLAVHRDWHSRCSQFLSITEGIVGPGGDHHLPAMEARIHPPPAEEAGTADYAAPTVGGNAGSDEEVDIITEGTAFAQAGPPHDNSVPPKIDSEKVILHEKVTKQNIKEGHGQNPTKFATCFLHYRGWVEKTLHMFEDTWQEQRPIELVLGKEKKQMAGLGIGIASMRSGERALLHVGWELGYGEEGSFSFPNIPPSADLIYEVELIGFDEVKEGKARSDMTVEERIGTADRKRMEGNNLFKEEKLEEAMQQYEMAIAYMGDDFMFQLFGKYRDMALAVKNPCHLNLAACLIKLKRYEEAIGQCSIVLTEDEHSVKALFRRGKARAELGQTDAAREDFEKAKKAAPHDRGITRELRLLAEHEKAVYQKQKELYKGIFGPRPEPKPKQRRWPLLFWQWLVSIFCYLFKYPRQKAD